MLIPPAIISKWDVYGNAPDLEQERLSIEYGYNYSQSNKRYEQNTKLLAITDPILTPTVFVSRLSHDEFVATIVTRSLTFIIIPKAPGFGSSSAQP